MSSGERTLAPATSCQMPMAMVDVSRMSATQCSQMSPAELFCSLPLPLAVALKDCAYTSLISVWLGQSEIMSQSGITSAPIAFLFSTML